MTRATNMTVVLLRIIQKYPIRIENTNVPFDIDVEEITGYHNPDKPNDLYWITDSPGLGVAKLSACDLTTKCKDWIWELDPEHLTTLKTYKTITGLYRAYLSDDEEWFAATEAEAVFMATESIRKAHFKNVETKETKEGQQ